MATKYSEDFLKNYFANLNAAQTLGLRHKREREPVTILPDVHNHHQKLLERYISGSALDSESITGIFDRIALYQEGLSQPPVGSYLITGPTGGGKTHFVNSVAKALHGGRPLRINCAEFQMEHEVAKLIGAPPGYLGHRETAAILSQPNIKANFGPRGSDSARPDGLTIDVILFDEIEKAAPSLKRLLLGVLDNGELMTGDNQKVNLTRCLFFFTSNLGTDKNPVGFGFETTSRKGIERDAINAHFAVEFRNRLSGVIHHPQITREGAKAILEKFYLDSQEVLRYSQKSFPMPSTATLKKVLDQGYSKEFGVRELRRAWERLVLLPFVRSQNQPQGKKVVTTS